MGSTVTGARIPNVNVFGRHVEVAAEHDRGRRVEHFVEPAGQPIKPCELRLVKRRANDPPVWRIEADNADVTAFSGDHAGLSERLVIGDLRCLGRTQGFTKIRDYAFDAAAARDCDAIPAAFAVMYQLVAG